MYHMNNPPESRREGQLTVAAACGFGPCRAAQD